MLVATRDLKWYCGPQFENHVLMPKYVDEAIGIVEFHYYGHCCMSTSIIITTLVWMIEYIVMFMNEILCRILFAANNNMLGMKQRIITEDIMLK